MNVLLSCCNKVLTVIHRGVRARCGCSYIVAGVAILDVLVLSFVVLG